MMAFVGPLLGLIKDIVIGYYQEWRKRQDVKIIERQKFALEGAIRAADAYAVKAGLRADPGAADSGVLIPDPTIPLPGDHPTS